MMIKVLLVVSFMIIIWGCSGHSSHNRYSKLTIADRFAEQYSSTSEGHTKVSFAHNLILKEFNPEYTIENDLILLADKYLDTVSTEKPIFSITICEPYNLDRSYDSRDIGPVRDHAILSIHYDTDSISSLPQIKGFTIWKNGKPISIEPIDVSERVRHLDSEVK